MLRRMSHTRFLEAVCDAGPQGGRAKAAVQLLRLLPGSYLVKQPRVLTRALLACAANRDLDQAWAVMEVVYKHHVKPDEIMYTALIKGEAAPALSRRDEGGERITRTYHVGWPSGLVGWRGMHGAMAACLQLHVCSPLARLRQKTTCPPRCTALHPSSEAAATRPPLAATRPGASNQALDH